MNELLLVLIVLVTFAGGYFVMDRVDHFLANSFQNEPPEYQKQVPSCMMLTDSLSDEELIHAIRQFAEQHEHISIILRDTLSPKDLTNDAGGNAA